MKLNHSGFFWLLTMFTAFMPAAALPFTQELRFSSVTFTAEVSGKIQGREFADYVFPGSKGQALRVELSPSSLSANFNIQPTGAKEAIYNSTVGGLSFSGELPEDGLYTVRVYLVSSAARRNKTSGYSLKLYLSPGEVPGGFDETLRTQGVSFRVFETSSGGIKRLNIIPFGLDLPSQGVQKPMKGRISGAESADLDINGFPEIYVYSEYQGSVSLTAYACNGRKSLTEIYMPELADYKNAAAGYRGGDEFSVLEGVLGRRFPIYADGDPDGKPSRGIRQLQYKLTPGEAGWLLKPVSVTEY